MTTTHFSQQELRNSVVVRIVAAVIFFCAFFFLPAGTIFFWEAWVYMAALLIPMMIFAVYLLRYNRALLERRMKMREKEMQQRWIIAVSSLLFLALLLLPGFDKRYGWSSVPTWLVIVANGMVLVGYLLVIYVLQKNEYAARTIEVEEEQEVITTGPYAIVRHPMYSAVTLLIIFTALALGSYWALIPAALLPLMLVARILNEEEVLRRELIGYPEYCEVVRYRLIPGIW